LGKEVAWILRFAQDDNTRFAQMHGSFTSLRMTIFAQDVISVQSVPGKIA
jgi:hypothetical protein